MSKVTTEVIINGVIYVPKEEVQAVHDTDGKPYVIVRTYSAGVFAGYLDSHQGKEGKLLEARRLWYWEGAASLSQLSIDGVACPDKCKFPEVVPYVKLTEIIEILPCSEKSRASIHKVKSWAI